MFFDAIHIFELLGQSMIMKFIYEHIKNAIETMGLESVVQVIMNNVSNGRSTSDLGTN
jgi:hypothetical protein